MAPLPPPFGGIGQWAKRFLELAPKYNLSADIVDETKNKGGHFFGKNSKISFFAQLKRNRSIWNELKAKLNMPTQTVVHCCIPSFSLSMLREYQSLKIAKKRGAKFIIHFRCTIPQISKSFFNKFLLKKFLKKSDSIIVLNIKSRDYLSSLSNKFLHKIQLIPNFVKDEEIGVLSLNFSNDIKNVLFVGGVVAEKGCDTILDVAKLMPAINFHLIGNPSTSIIQQKESEQLNNVFLHGEQNHDYIRKIISNTDLFLFLSKYNAEGFSNALVEATACGLPCIATDWASNKEQLGLYSDLCIVNIDSPQEVVEVMKKINDKRIRLTISKYNINHTKKNYAESVVMNKYIDIYDRIIKY